MLDKKIFATQLGELAAYHNRKISAFVQRVWYKHLGHLTTEQFERAVETALTKCEFMPTPEQLAEFAGTGQKIQILDHWQRIEQGRKSFPTTPDAVKDYDNLISSLNLDPVALKALKTLGGLGALSRLGDQDIKWSRDRFIEYYQLFDSQRDQLELEAQAIQALKATAEKPALPPSTADSEALATLGASPVPEFVLQDLQAISDKMTLPSPAKAVGTQREYKAIAQDLIQSWRLGGKIEEDF